jgi:hypothetical protein
MLLRIIFPEETIMFFILQTKKHSIFLKSKAIWIYTAAVKVQRQIDKLYALEPDGLFVYQIQ